MIIILNHKCHFNLEEFLDYQKRLESIVTPHQLVLCPSFLYLSVCSLPNFLLGAQNVSPYHCGAYTGEVSASQLKSMKVSYALVGHSERRNYFQEDEKQIKQKIVQCLENNITPVFCVGEANKEEARKKIGEQLEMIEDLEQKEKIVIAYEPVWAIGSGRVPTISEIEQIVLLIKKRFPNNPVIYGGSIHDENIYSLKSHLLDGYLLGGLSLNDQRLQRFLSQLS